MKLQWIEIKIITRTEAVEAISYMLTELGIKGVRIDDPKDILMQEKDECAWDYVDEALLQSKDPDVVEIFCYLSEEDYYLQRIEEIKSRLAMIAQFIPIGEGTVTLQKVKEEEWANAWKQYYKPFRAAKQIVIEPTWEKATFVQEGDQVIKLDPGMAFGTGTHETTSLCIQSLEKYVTPNDTILDIGCGSGILGIVAGKLGAKKVIGVDIDPNAIKVAKENVQINQVDEIVEIRQGDLLEVVEEKTDCIVANIIADVIIKLVESVPQVLRPKGFFIASGIIMERLEEVKQAIEKSSFDLVEVLTKGDWAAVVARKKE
ncbi:MAG: 50S ribosomal protein L11 methyltransferase [Epulopiscium sp.]|nr:50S ribosomal protein L11 methyltransferase [Candidatus Epulonipiscium sp.]